MLYGHEDKKELFRRLAESDNLSHAYLFYGYSGIGKFYFARALASFLESGEFDPAGAGEEKPLIDSRIFLPDEKRKIGVEHHGQGQGIPEKQIYKNTSLPLNTIRKK